MHLASGLRKRGHQTAILCVFQEGHDAEEVRRQGISLASLDLQQGWGPREFFRIFDWLRSNPVDVLHAYLFGFHVFAGLPARLLKVPVVLSSRREIAQWQKRRHLWVENMGNLLVDRVVSCSKAVEKWTLAKERISPEKVITIYNGINLGRFRPTGNRIKVRENLGIPLDAPLVGTVANMAVEKGYPYLLEAAEQILKEDPRVWFLFVGFGPLDREVKAWARKIPGHERIVFPGARTDIPDLVEAMDIFVLASVIEGFPNVLLEAMAMARPVVATAVGGIPELVEPGRDGFLVAPRDGKALAEAVLSLVRNPKRAEEMGLRGKEKITQHFSLDRMIDEYENLYLSLFRQKSPRISNRAILQVPSPELVQPLTS